MLFVALSHAHRDLSGLKLTAGVVTSLAEQQTWQDANSNVVPTQLCDCQRPLNEQRATLVLLLPHNCAGRLHLPMSNMLRVTPACCATKAGKQHVDLLVMLA